MLTADQNPVAKSRRPQELPTCLEPVDRGVCYRQYTNHRFAKPAIDLFRISRIILYDGLPSDVLELSRMEPEVLRSALNACKPTIVILKMEEQYPRTYRNLKTSTKLQASTELNPGKQITLPLRKDGGCLAG
jgi:hypothetical protein